MNHAAAMGHHILEPIINTSNAAAAATTSISADSKIQMTKPVQAGHSGMNKSFDFVNNTVSRR